MDQRAHLPVKQEVVGILGHGEIGSSIARICKEAGFKILVRELAYDELKGNKVDYLHVNIPDHNANTFVQTVASNIKELSPKLTIINSSVTPGVTRRIYKITKSPIVHSPVIGLHPNLYKSIKYYFPKILGPINKRSENEARKHFKRLGLKIEIYDSPENSEIAKLLDLAYYAWNIVFCKWVSKTCTKIGLNFDQVYTRQNQIYNKGYGRFLPNVVRPILIPVPGPITGHCTIPDTELFHKFYKNRLTAFILEENKRYYQEEVSTEKERQKFLKKRKLLSKQISKS